MVWFGRAGGGIGGPDPEGFFVTISPGGVTFKNEDGNGTSGVDASGSAGK